MFKTKILAIALLGLAISVPAVAQTTAGAGSNKASQQGDYVSKKYPNVILKNNKKTHADKERRGERRKRPATPIQ